MKEVNVSGEKNAENGKFAALYYIRMLSFCKTSKYVGTSIASLDSETVNYLHSPYSLPFYRSVWPTREAKPCSGAALKCSVHDDETCTYKLAIVPNTRYMNPRNWS